MTHQEVIDLLPWYANATLSESEQREIDAHLSSCADCTKELNELKTIQLAVVESAQAVPDPSKALLNRAVAEIDAFERDRKRTAAKSGSWLSEILERAADPLLGWLGPMPSPARALVAAQFLVIVGLAGGLSYSLWESKTSTTLSGTQQVRTDHSRIKIGFDESITEAQLRQLLSEFRGEIVAGPSAQGLYTVEVPIRPANTDELDRLVQSLRRKQQLIRFAEIEE